MFVNVFPAVVGVPVPTVLTPKKAPEPLDIRRLELTPHAPLFIPHHDLTAKPDACR